MDDTESCEKKVKMQRRPCGEQAETEGDRGTKEFISLSQWHALELLQLILRGRCKVRDASVHGDMMHDAKLSDIPSPKLWRMGKNQARGARGHLWPRCRPGGADCLGDDSVSTLVAAIKRKICELRLEL